MFFSLLAVLLYAPQGVEFGSNVISSIGVLRQCAGEFSNFFNNTSNLLVFGSKHCSFDLNAKMTPFCVFCRRLLWKQGKTAAILGIW